MTKPDKSAYLAQWNQHADMCFGAAARNADKAEAALKTGNTDEARMWAAIAYQDALAGRNARTRAMTAR